MLLIKGIVNGEHLLKSIGSGDLLGDTPLQRLNLHQSTPQYTAFNLCLIKLFP